LTQWRKLLTKYAIVHDRLVTDDLRSYGAALRNLKIGRDTLNGIAETI